MGVETQAHKDGAHRTRAAAHRVRASWALAAAGLAGATLIAAAAGCEPEAPPWAAGAQEYVDAYNSVFQSGFSNTAPFYAEDATFDGRFLIGAPPRPQARAHHPVPSGQRPARGPRPPATSSPLTRDEPLYLSAAGAVDPVWIHTDPSIVHLATTYTFSPDGITSDTWAGQVKGVEMYLGVPVSEMDPLAHGYLDAWASGDPAAVRARYAPEDASSATHSQVSAWRAPPRSLRRRAGR